MRYARYIPGPVLQRTLFGTAMFRAIRATRPALWRPLAEAVLGDTLVVKAAPRRIIGIMPEVLAFDGGEVETNRWFVIPGDWDVNPMRFEDHKTYPRMRDLLSEDWKQSASYRELIALQLEGKLPDRVKKIGRTNKTGQKVSTVDAYFNYYHELADKMAKTRAIPNLGADDKDRYIGIAIGRDGQIVQQQRGHHRAIIAQFVACEVMEAKVLAVHPLWVKRLGCRMDAIKNGLTRLSV